MSDHADTIRLHLAWTSRADREEVNAALDALLAERQQAIDALELADRVNGRLALERRQAIDALRLGVKFEREYQRARGATWTPSMQMYLDRCQREFTDAAALVKLGEQP